MQAFEILLFKYCIIILIRLKNYINMKNLLYVIAVLLIIIWIIVFQPTGLVHLLLILAAFVILITIIFNKKLSGK